MAKAKTNEVEEAAEAATEKEEVAEVIGEDAIINEPETEVAETETLEAPAVAESDDEARLKNLIEVHRSLAHTRGEDQEFEFAGRTYKVFQDGVVQIIQTDEPE